MRIRRIHTHIALMSKDHKFSFDVKDHKLDFYPELNMFSIDGDTFVPVSNIREVLLEPEVTVIPEVETKLKKKK